MRLFAERLPEQLKKELRPIYALFGNEPLLLEESRLAIQHAAQAQGFEERHRFAIDSHFDWQPVYDCCHAMSLFSARQLIELELPEAGVNTAIAKELTTLCEQIHSDILLVVIGGKLTKAQESAKWFKALTQHGTWVSCLSPDLNRLPQFVQFRCHKLGLKPDSQALQMLAQWHEGNLLALTQSLEKLALLYPDGELTMVRIEHALSRHNHYNAFHWVDALLAGKADRAQRILRQLEAEGVEGIILLRTVQKELKQLINMQRDGRQMTQSQVLDKYRVWQNKKPLYSAALTRLSHAKLQRFVRLLTESERVFKTQYEQPVWPLIHQLSLEICCPDIELAFHA